MARVGILGGSFNPPHVAHLVCAQEARDQLGLDHVLLVPVATPPHKELDADPGVQARVTMTELACAGAEGLAVSLLEVDRGGSSYTADTLRALHDSGPQDELTLIVGGDMAYSLPTWREPEVLASLARIGVAERSGSRQEDIAARLAGVAEHVDFFAMPRLDVSSSDIRRRVAAGRPIRNLVRDSVADFIGAHALYKTGDR